jgi:hypothetical protein
MTARMTGLLVTAVAVSALTAQSALAVGSAPTTYWWSTLALSRDGHHWSSDLRRPLFGRHLVLVPGSTEERTFHVRNQSGEQARLEVSAGCGRGSLRPHPFRIAVRDHPRGWRPAGGNRVVRRLVATGAVVPVTVRVRLPAHAGGSEMDQRCLLKIRVRLAERNQVAS